MRAFMCTKGVLSRCDAPRISGSDIDKAAALGFKPQDMSAALQQRSGCLVCRPADDQDVYLTIHGMERSIYAMVVWQHGNSSTFIFAATPFDLATIVDHVARYERAMHDIHTYGSRRARPTDSSDA